MGKMKKNILSKLFAVMMALCVIMSYSVVSFADDNSEENNPPEENVCSHEIVTVDATDSTCTVAGHDLYYYCSKCDMKFSDADGSNQIEEPVERELAAHNFIDVAEVPATCSSNGKIAHSECSVCKALEDGVTLESLVIPATNEHSYVNGVCECGVLENATATIGDTQYATLAEALASAHDGDTVTLIKDVTSSEICSDNKPITVKGKILTIDGNGKKITRDAEYAGKMIAFTNCDITLKDVDMEGGAGEWSYTYTVKTADSYAPENIVVSENENAIIANTPAFTTSGGKLTVNDSKFAYFRSTENGAVFSASKTDVIMTDTKMEYNRISAVSKNGTVFFSDGGSVTLNNCTAINNGVGGNAEKAYGYGGVASVRNGSLVVNGGSYSKNFSGMNSGVFAVNTCTKYYIDGAAFTENICGNDGGVSQIDGHGIDCKITNSTFTKQNGLAHGNQSLGSCFYTNSMNANYLFDNCTFTSCEAAAATICINNNPGDPALRCNTTINNCTFDKGVNVAIECYDVLEMKNTKITNYTVEGSRYAGLIPRDYLKATIEDCEFSNNNGYGVLYCGTNNEKFADEEPGAMILKNTVIKGNTTTSGTILVRGGGVLTLDEGTVVTGNKGYCGGGIWVVRKANCDWQKNNNKAIMKTGSKVFNNIAERNGDDIWVQSEGDGTTSSTLILIDAAEMSETGLDGYKIDGWYSDATDNRYDRVNHANKYERLVSDPDWFASQPYSSVSLKAAGKVKDEPPVTFIPAPVEPESLCTVTYTDGVADEVVFEDQNYSGKKGDKTPEFNGTPSRDGYEFVGWDPEVSPVIVTDTATYTAVWKVLDDDMDSDALGNSNKPVDKDKDSIDGDAMGNPDSINDENDDISAVPNGVKTSDETDMMIYLSIFTAALLALCISVLYARRRRED